MILLAACAFATEPVLLPFSHDPVVGDHAARTGVSGSASSTGTYSADALVEVAFASRVGVAVTAGFGTEAALLGGEVRAELLDQETAPIGLGIGARYRHIGFDGADAEAEVALYSAYEAGALHLFLDATAGKDLVEPEGDVESALAATGALSEIAALGIQGQVRSRIGEGDEIFEGTSPWEARVGGLFCLGEKRVSGFAFAGAEFVGAQPAALVSVGVQLSL